MLEIGTYPPTSSISFFIREIYHNQEASTQKTLYQMWQNNPFIATGELTTLIREILLNNIGSGRRLSTTRNHLVIGNFNSQEIIRCPPGDVRLPSSWSRFKLYIQILYKHQASIIQLTLANITNTSQRVAYLNKCVTFAVIDFKDGCHISTPITVVRCTKNGYHLLILQKGQINLLNQ